MKIWLLKIVVNVIAAVILGVAFSLSCDPPKWAVVMLMMLIASRP